MDFIFVVCLLVILAGLLIVIGREFEERYPAYIDFASESKPSTLVQQLRTGVFMAMDFGSDMIWPGSRHTAIAFKRARQTKEELKQKPGG